MQKQFILSSFLFCTLTASSFALANPIRQALDKEQHQRGTLAFTAHNYKPGIIQHIVLFKFRKTVSPAQIQEVRQRFLALKKLAKRGQKTYIKDITAGPQNSGEGVDHGYQEGFIVTFNSEGDRNYYVGTPVVTNPKFYDPEHQKFKDFVGPLLAKDNGVLVFDFRASAK